MLSLVSPLPPPPPPKKLSVRFAVTVQSLNCVWLSLTPWTIARQASSSVLGISQAVGCHFLLLRIFPTQRSNPCLLHWQADSLPLSHQEKPINEAFPMVQWIKNPPANAGDMGSISGSRKWEGNGNPLQYPCLGNPMDIGVWWATVHEVPSCRTWLSKT